MQLMKRKLNFNPRSLTGATVGILPTCTTIVQFQSTLPHGSDCKHVLVTEQTYYFNPRSLTGATIKYFNRRIYMYISIHAPSRERLLDGESVTITNKISIHAPSRERPQIAYLFVQIPRISIHAPSRERRSSSVLLSSQSSISIHAPSRERLL